MRSAASSKATPASHRTKNNRPVQLQSLNGAESPASSHAATKPSRRSTMPHPSTADVGALIDAPRCGTPYSLPFFPRSRSPSSLQPDKYELRRAWLRAQARAGKVSEATGRRYEMKDAEALVQSDYYPDFSAEALAQKQQQARWEAAREKERAEIAAERKEHAILQMVEKHASRTNTRTSTPQLGPASITVDLQSHSSLQLKQQPSLHPLLLTPDTPSLSLLLQLPSCLPLVAHLASYLYPSEVCELALLSPAFHHVISLTEDHSLFALLTLENLLRGDKECEAPGRIDRQVKIMRARRQAAGAGNAWRMKDGYNEDVRLPAMKDMPTFRPPPMSSHSYAPFLSSAAASSSSPILDYHFCPYTLRTWKQLYLQHSFLALGRHGIAAAGSSDFMMADMPGIMWMTEDARRRIGTVAKRFIRMNAHSVSSAAAPAPAGLSSTAGFRSFLTDLHREFPPMPEALRFVWKEMRRQEDARLKQVGSSVSIMQPHRPTSVQSESGSAQTQDSNGLAGRRAVFARTPPMPVGTNSASVSSSAVPTRPTVHPSEAFIARSGLLSLDDFRTVWRRLQSVGVHWHWSASKTAVTDHAALTASVQDGAHGVEVTAGEWSEMMQVARWSGSLKPTTAAANAASQMTVDDERIADQSSSAPSSAERSIDYQRWLLAVHQLQASK